MDAGVPMKAPVAGVAMGLVKEGDQFAVLTDILGDEDHLGDMDFKVAGTAQGVTALQMDIKIDGITEEIMETALGQAHEARLHILGEMNSVISASRATVSENAPSMVVLKVDPDKIPRHHRQGWHHHPLHRRRYRRRSGCGRRRQRADLRRRQRVQGRRRRPHQEITAEAEVGKIYSGRVARIVDFGAFITILPGKDGLLHISQIAEERVEKVTDYLEEGSKSRSFA